MSHPSEQPDVEMLDWYIAMGVDEVISDQPADWFARSIQQKTVETHQTVENVLKNIPNLNQRNSAPARSGAAAPVIPPDEAIMKSREQARSAHSLEDLEKILSIFEGCNLKSTAKNTCFSRGSKDASVMFVGEAPGRDEDIQGLPFVGRAGQLLDKMLASIGLDETNAYITNIVYWRPPGNRTPTPQEAQICRPFLYRQIELVNPELLVFLGGAAAKQMLDTTEGIMRLRGKWQEFRVGDQSYRAIATLHPAYLLRTPAAKRLVWRDLLAIQSALQPSKNS